MCGIVFAAGLKPVQRFIERAHTRQHHRGPDAEGLHFERCGDAFVGFAHERLSIIDLTEQGRQPMASGSGNTLIVFNGEIYNYQELAAKYALQSMRSGSDTEVALELIEKLGIEVASREFNGMWALAVYDRSNRRIHISRDRFGKKPLYYAQVPGGIVFASEMHSLLLHEDVSRTADGIVASRFLGQSLMDVDERSWIEGIRSFPAASTGYVDVSDSQPQLRGVARYWSVDAILAGSDAVARPRDLEELHDLVTDSVLLRLHADVPVGIALSGGLDSSIISAVAARTRALQDRGVQLFSVTSPGSAQDESEYIHLMAKHLHTPVREVSLGGESGDALLGLLRTCVRHNDGPVASFSNVLFYKLMEAAAGFGITVILTGQGADEAFCGYRKYPVLQLRNLVDAGQYVDALRFGAGMLRRGTVTQGLRYAEVKRYLGRQNSSVLGPATRGTASMEPMGSLMALKERQWRDIAHLSVPYLCHYEDRMSMAWGREVRAPFLDYRLVEMGLRMAPAMKMAGGWTKYPLRKAFEHDLPPQITWRKDKKGFTNPEDEWMRGKLRATLVEIMSDPGAEVYRTGLADRAGYLHLLNAYLAGNPRIWFREVFAPFSLELWLQSLSELQPK